MDRAFDFGSKGWGFDSLQAYKIIKIIFIIQRKKIILIYRASNIAF